MRKSQAPVQPDPRPTPVAYRYLKTEAEAAQALQALASASMIAIDTETAYPRQPEKQAVYSNGYNRKPSGELAPLDARTSEVRLVQVKGETTPPLLFDLWLLPEASQKALAAFLAGFTGTFIGHNLKFDLKQLYASLGVWLDESATLADTFQASRLLANSVGAMERGSSLAAVARDFLKVRLDKTQQVSDWSVNPLSAEQLEYAALDVLHLHRLWIKLKHYLEEDLEQVEPLRLEMAVIGPTARMEWNGVPFDEGMYRKVQEAARFALPELIAKIGGILAAEQGVQRTPHTFEIAKADGSIERRTFLVPYFGGKAGFDLMQATAKVLALLQQRGLVDEKGEELTSTSKLVLEMHRESDPLVAAMLDFKMLQKQSQFDYDQYVHPLTGRIHPTFNISGASTGRFSAKDPNVQQIPAKFNLTHPDGSKLNYRYCFASGEPHGLIVSSDFSGQELSVMAALSEDPVMVNTLNTGGDIHAEAAAGLYNIDPAQARQPIPGGNGATYRDRGKVLVFSLAYGKTAEGFAEMWKMPLEETKQLIANFQAKFSTLSNWLKVQGDLAEVCQYAKLPIGAMRFVGGDGESNSAKNSRRRQGGNYMIQGSSSWMTRIAMIELDKTIRQEGLPLKLIACIHDELLLELETAPDCATRQLKAGEATLTADEAQAACEARCNPKTCAHHLIEVVGAHMQAAGEALLEGIVPANFSTAVARHWEH